MNQNRDPRRTAKAPVKKNDTFIRKKRIKEKKKKEKGPKERSVFSRILSGFAIFLLTVLLIGFITGLIVVGTFAMYIKDYIDPVIDDFDTISTEQKLSSKIYYMDYTDRENRVGTPVEIESETLYGSENRIWVSFTEMPTYLYEAFISIEDERYWTHNGVDWKRTIGATYYFFTGGDHYGGSTITQQLIKNITNEKDVTIQRKLQEIMRALYLDKTKDKTEVLELYLNTIYLSQGCYGVQAAANVYFGKDVSELTLTECAALASITQAPTKWDPIQNPDNNKERRNRVLKKMYELGKITYSEYQDAKNEELVLKKNTANVEGEPSSDDKDYNTWYTDAVIRSIVERLQEEKGYPENLAYNMLYSGGLKIYTVLDPDIQAALDSVYVNETEVFQDHRLPGVFKPESSMVIIHPTTGDVLGIAGGRGEKQGNLILNYATQTTRSPGSSIKPVTVYAPALEAGVITMGSVYDDVPVNFDTGKYTDHGGSVTYYYEETGQTVTRNTGWPSNSPKRYDGRTTVDYAVCVSKNTVAVRVLQDLTCEASFDFAKNKLHMDSLIERLQLSNGEWISDKGLVALAMGEMNYGVTNLEITAAYSIFTNKGTYNQPRLYTEVLDNDDNLILDDGCESSVVISETNASIMTRMLKGVVDSGTARHAVALRNRVNVAGKTGTTNADHDRWFIGYTPYLLGGVWYGYAEPDSLSKVSGNPAAFIWDRVMTIAHQKYFDKAAETGEGIKTFTYSNEVARTVCRDSGKICTSVCSKDLRGHRGVTAYFAPGTEPKTYCDKHVLVKYDEKTKSIACPGCPPKDVIEIALVDASDRNFPRQVTVTDADHTCRILEADAPLSTNLNEPYYAAALNGKFAGTVGNTTHKNHACVEHIKTPYVEETTTQEVVATTPPDKPEDTEPGSESSGTKPVDTTAPGGPPDET
ncbi:MAG: transglycosylase domain-containing protein [Clostridia bacterium]|nr:transglycosylase domain-containing protein [Clostridia bacterium]